MPGENQRKSSGPVGLRSDNARLLFDFLVTRRPSRHPEQGEDRLFS